MADEALLVGVYEGSKCGLEAGREDFGEDFIRAVEERDRPIVESVGGVSFLFDGYDQGVGKVVGNGLALEDVVELAV